MQGFDFGTIFFNAQNWTDNKTTFNGLQFERNELNTHFNATSIMDQCGQLSGKTSKKGQSSKNWSDFMRGDSGRLLISNTNIIELKRSRNNVYFVPYKYLHTILQYSMTLGYLVDKYFANEYWIEKEGFVYLNYITLDNDEVVYKYGRTADYERRMKQYQNSYNEEGFRSLCYKAVRDQYAAEPLIGAYLAQHGAIQHKEGNEFFIVPNKDYKDIIEMFTTATETIEGDELEELVE